MTNHTTVSQNVAHNEKDYEAIREKLKAIILMAEKYKQHGSQRALDRRVEELSMWVVLSSFRGLFAFELTNVSVL
jgi:hypothetical protein